MIDFGLPPRAWLALAFTCLLVPAGGLDWWFYLFCGFAGILFIILYCMLWAWEEDLDWQHYELTGEKP